MREIVGYISNAANLLVIEMYLLAVDELFVFSKIAVEQTL
jgi:hypothetical protein